MIIYKSSKEINDFLLQRKNKGETIGFAPTMGALHKGHTGLITKAKEECNLVISSIFINPTQFNDPKDFEKYPSTIEKDIYALETSGCDVLFLPSVNEIYPNGLLRAINYNLGYLDTILEANYRPGHYQGVCQVVEKLLRIVNPDNLYLGQKDYQQCLVIQKLAKLINLPVKVIICPTQRENSGLAMSSRNMRLNEEEKIKAAKIYETLLLISQEIKNDTFDLKSLKEKGIMTLTSAGFKVDYLEFANAATLELISEWDGKTSMILLIAAFLSGVRLIDNLVV